MTATEDASWQLDVVDVEGGSERGVALRLHTQECVVHVLLNPVEAAQLHHALGQAAERARRETINEERSWIGLGRLRPT